MMNYSIANELMSRDKWQEDSKANKCDHCDRSFISMFRRKHHCRRCGHLFCSDCSNYFMDGYQFNDMAEKKVRLCSRCYEAVQKLMRTPQTEKIEKLSLSHRESLTYEQPVLISSRSMNVPKSLPEELIDLEFNPDIEQESINNLFEETIKTHDMDSLKQQLKDKSSQQLELIFEHCLKSLISSQKEMIVENWKTVMCDFIKRAVEDVQFSSLNGDPMDINFYVKTKTIPYHDHSMTGYFKGVVFRKNVALKKMTVQFKSPKIMIIVGALDMVNTTTQFDDYINKEKKTIQEYIDKIKDQFKPNLILVEKSANKIALDLCYKFGITVVHNIKMHLIRKIAKCTQAKYVKLEKLDEYIKKKSNVLGYCENIVFRNFPKPKSEKPDAIMKDSTLMFIETKDGQNGVTITLSGPQEDLLTKLKQCIVGCMRLAKHFDVERHMILTEMRLRGNKNLSYAGDFTKYLFDKLPLKEIIKADLAYVKVNYVMADIHNFNDIKDNQALQLYQKEYQTQKVKIVDFFAEMCSIPSEKSKALYHSSDDISLGAFIILKVSNMDSKCEICKLSRNSHVSIYYTAGKYVRICVDSKQENQVLPPPLLRKQTSIQSQPDDESKLFTHKDVAKILLDNHKKDIKKKIKIETYIECNQCQQKLTERTALSQHNLEYSFLRMLQHLFLTSQNSQEQKQNCEHTQLQRVFTYDDSKVKVMVGDFDVYSTSLLNYNDQNLSEHLSKWEIQYTKTKREELILKINFILQQLINQIPKSLLKSEIDLLHKTIKQLLEEFEKNINELQITHFFQIDKLSFDYGLQIKSIYQRIMDHKKKKELNQDFRNIIQNATKLMEYNKESIIVRTAQDLDRLESQSINSIYQQPENLIKSAMNSKHDTEEMIQMDDEIQTNSMKYDLTDLMIPNETSEQCHTPLGGRPIGQQKNLQQSSLRDLDRQTNEVFEREFNFSKEWSLCSFMAEQQKLVKNQVLFDFVPIYENQPLSYLAFALNHQKYIQEIHNKENFHLYEVNKTNETKNQLLSFLFTSKQDPKQTEIRQNEILEPRFQSLDLSKPDKDCFVLKINYDLEKRSDKSPNLNGLEEHIDRSTTQGGIPLKKSKFAEVLIYFPAQFEALRILCGVSLEKFIKSISSSVSWSAQGGKSQSKFYKSNDQLFIFKKLEQDKEFLMFKKFAMDYFRHIHRHFHEKPSLLSKIYGMFEIRDRGTTEYFLVMENLFYGMGDPKDLTVYDLKGSETNRWEKKKKAVLLDTNFRIDRNAEPIPIIKENYRFNDRAFQMDCKFLNKQNVIDYSLLLIIDNKNRKLRMGIIDYLRFYTWDKETEHYLKYILKGGMVPTIVNPADYKKRFIGAMQKYFIAV